MPENDDLALLTGAARAAGEIAMQHFRQDPKVWDKGGGEGPVTEADLAVNAMLEDRLRTARPDYGWLSEESPNSTTGAGPSFVIDPIDGTRAFIEGTTAFAHALAVVRDGRPTAAVVYLPAQDRLFAATAGGGATLNAAPIAVAAREGLRDAAVLATKPALRPDHWPGGVPAVARVYRPSLAYRICLVAQGRFDAMITLRDTWEWDIAAAALIAGEAGATVTDRNGRPLRLDGARALHPGCFVAPAPIHRALMAHRRGPAPPA
ncbi:MAG: 3'(2'),5'-bisphosphate nucleotidase CysQ [Pseudomonadota bacterium]